MMISLDFLRLSRSVDGESCRGAGRASGRSSAFYLTYPFLISFFSDHGLHVIFVGRVGLYPTEAIL